MKMSDIIHRIEESSGDSKIGIGYAFVDDSKNTKYVTTVRNIYTTTNSKGKVIDVSYLVDSDYMGQKVSQEISLDAIKKMKPAKGGK